MKPQKDDHIRCVFRNGTVLDGVVMSWSDTQSVLKSSDQSTLIINQTQQDVMIIKILVSAIKVKTQLEQQFEQILQQPSNDELRIKKLADLRVMMADADRKIIADKLKDHSIGEIRKPKYEQPKLFQKPSTK